MQDSHQDQKSNVEQAVPRHVAIIMDGNGRWATQRGRPRLWGHKKGVECVRDVVAVSVERGLEALTLYAFSEENWGRPQQEISGIMGLLDAFIVRELQKLVELNVELRVMGCLERLPAKTRDLVGQAVRELSGNRGLTLNIALSYGSKTEMVSAFRGIASAVSQGKIEPSEITPEIIDQHLWTAGLPEPDLLIRTSGEQRLSNFLLWQLAYTELWFTPVMWPDFGRAEFMGALEAYAKRKRRFGLLDS